MLCLQAGVWSPALLIFKLILGGDRDEVRTAIYILHLQYSAGSYRENVIEWVWKRTLSALKPVFFGAVVATCKAARTVLPCGVLGVRALGVLGFGGKVGLRVQEADGLEVMVLGILFLKMRWEPASESE